jgi:hypothetical protein
VLAQIEHMRPQDRDFLAYQCKWLLVTITQHQDSAAFALARSIQVTAETLKESQVSPRFRRLFPSGPRERNLLDEFIEANPG